MRLTLRRDALELGYDVESLRIQDAYTSGSGRDCPDSHGAWMDGWIAYVIRENLWQQQGQEEKWQEMQAW